MEMTEEEKHMEGLIRSQLTGISQRVRCQTLSEVPLIEPNPATA